MLFYYGILQAYTRGESDTGTMSKCMAKKQKQIYIRVYVM